MKRIISLLLVAAMLVCMIPAFTIVYAAGDDVQYGLNAEFFVTEGTRSNANTYINVIGTVLGKGARAEYDDCQKFDQSIDQLLKISKEMGSAQGLTGITPHDAGAKDDGYLIKWTGTITAETSGTYYFVGNKVDNGIVIKVDGKKVYEYWASNHWFDADGINLYTNLGGFELTAGKATDIEIWYLETDGGEALQMSISTSPDSGATDFASAGITLALDATWYQNNVLTYQEGHDIINGILPAGVNAEGTPVTDLEGGESNGCPADNPANHNYASTIDRLKEKMYSIGTVVVPNFFSESFSYGAKFGHDYDDFLIEYNGYITPAVSGEYLFGTKKVDNCLFVEITDPDTGDNVTIYEFWASKIWNDNSTTYYDTPVELEAGKSYKIHATFLEINGGEGVEPIVKIDGVETEFAATGLTFTTEPLEAAPEITTNYFFNTATEWRYLISSDDPDAAGEGWNSDPSVSADWEVANAPFGNRAAGSNNIWATDDGGNINRYLWAVKEFTVEDVSDYDGWALMLNTFFDDTPRIYVNGELFFTNDGWNEGYTNYKLAENAADYLKTGSNIIAVSLEQHTGGYEFDAALYVTKDDTSSYLPMYVNISNADQLLAFAAGVNANVGATKGQIVNIEADIDMQGKTWTPLQNYFGTINGNGHSIKNLSYTATVDAANGEQYVGLFATNVGNNNNVKGKIDSIVFENATLTVNATETDTNKVFAGIIAGKVDRGCISGCTVKGSTLLSNGAYAGAVAGGAEWAHSELGVVVENCTVDTTSVTAKNAVGAIVGATGGNDSVYLGEVKVNYSEFNVTDPEGTVSYTAGVLRGGGNVVAEDITVKSDLSLGDGKDYEFYYQTRTNADDPDAVDFRIICVTKYAYIEGSTSVGIEASFTNGSDTVDFSRKTSTVFKNVDATGDGYTDVYTTDSENVIFGWVITGVPSDYTVTAATMLK